MEHLQMEVDFTEELEAALDYYYSHIIMLYDISLNNH